MKVFVGFGYNENDRWIKNLVIPLIQFFGAEVLTGEDLHGEVISQAVVDRIKRSDGLFAFLTRRDELRSGRFTTHRWVTDELSAAITNNIPAVEMLENSVDVPGGLPGDRQRFVFDSNSKADVLIEVAKVLSGWQKRFTTASLVILPDEIVQQARPYIREGRLRCTYQFKDGNEESKRYETIPFRLPDSLAVDIKNIPSKNALVQMIIEGPDNFSWSCGYQPFNMVPIKLQKD